MLSRSQGPPKDSRPPIVLRFRSCLQTTRKLAIIIMSSCSKLWQWNT